MNVIIIMCAGILISKIFFPVKWKHINELIQLICTLLLIFSIGVLLGSREDFLNTITTVGFQSFLFFLLPAVCSVIVVYPLTKIFLNNKKRNGKDEI